MQQLLEVLGAEMSPASLRELAESILKFADSVDQDWNPEQVKSNFSIFSKAGRVERSALVLSRFAMLERRRADVREEIFGSDVIGIPAWHMLLELFMQFAGGAKVSTKSLQIIARCPETTALRVIDRLEQRGLVKRSHSEDDRRVTFVSLTREGVAKVGTVLERLAD